MNNFWTLVRFELKKIFQRKVFFISIIICIGGVCVLLFSSLSGNTFEHKAGSDISQYKAMKMDKETIMSKRGDITSELIREAILSNKEMKSNDDNYMTNEYGKHLKSDAYIKYILPYESIVNVINVVYEKDLDWFSMDTLNLISVKPEKAIDSLTPDHIQNFDNDLKEFTIAMLNRKAGLSAPEIAKNINLMEQIKNPLYNDYYGGYEAYINSSKGLALTVLFLILILLAPLFSAEYEEKTEQLLLCTKNGKNSLCKAKIFMAVVVSLFSSILIMGISWLSLLVIFGFEGGNVNIQVINPSCTYPLTLLEACQIHFISVIMASVLFGAFIAFLSAKVKRKTFSVIVIGTLVTIIPMFIWMPLNSSRFLYNVLQLFPVNSVTFKFDMHFIEIFGTLFTPYKFVWIIGAILMIAFSFMAIRSFKNHQVS